MHALLMSCCPNPNPNVIECAKNNSGIKILKHFPRALRPVLKTTLLGFWLKLIPSHMQKKLLLDLNPRRTYFHS